MVLTKPLRFLFHAAGWILFFCLIIAFASGGPERKNFEDQVFSPSSIGFLAIYIFIFYLNKEWLLPAFYLRRKYLLYGLAFILLLLIIYFLRPYDLLMGHGLRIGEAHPPFEPEHHQHRERHGAAFDIVGVVLFFTTWSVSTALEIIQKWRHTETRALQAETDKANAELSFLKAQVNPHFLFNTLNNIYAMALAKSDNTPAAIMKLSNIMRYVTDEVVQNQVPLVDELNCARDYIDLQKMRLSEKTKVQFAQEGPVEGKRIAPLVLMTFIENVFKYGVSNHQSSDITIQVSTDENNLKLFCRNRIFPANEKTERAGIGIANTKKRLDAIYQGQYQLDINTDNDYFNVELKLQLQ